MLSFVQFNESASNEHLSTILQKHGGQYGTPAEKIKHLSPTVSLHSKKEWGNHRFVKHDGNGNPLAAVQIVSNKKHHGHVSTAYTHPDHRRKGYASELIQHAKKTFPHLKYSEHRSDDGKAFVKALSEALHHEPLPFHHISDDQKKAFVKHRQTFNRNHGLSLSDYKDEASEFNRPLRKGMTAHDHPRYGDIRNLDHITSSKSIEPMTVYRGIGSGIAKRLKPGYKFTDKAYVSTSFDPKQAHKFSGKGKVLAKIHVPAGSHGHPLDLEDEHGKPAPFNYGGRHEHEHLLPRGTKFEVSHHSKHVAPDGTHHKVIHMNVVGHIHPDDLDD
jgi:GNAT superfamily N-acetyltransferase